MRATLAVFAVGLGLALSPAIAPVGSPAIEVYTITLTIPTYPFAAFVETHHSDQYNMDYPWLDRPAYEASGPQPSPQDYTGLVVENPWLRLIFLPELGGRLYGVTLKATGEELLYQNPVIKPTDWGPPEQAWWLAVGGMEWCLPVAEHGYEWGVPWDYDVKTSGEGATVTLWDTMATDRLRTRIQVHLPADQAAIQVRPRLENPTGVPVPLSFWTNAMLAPGAANTAGAELRFVIPIDQVTVHSRGDDYLPGAGQAMSWPFHNGTDYSRLGNWNRWLGFFARPQAAQDWAGIYDEGIRRGVARVFPREVAGGVKGFGFGWADPIDASQWTDDGSFYVELHSGPSRTFWDSITLGAGETLEWTEMWLPIQELPRLSLATRDLALGLKAVGADLQLGLQVAGQRDGLGLRLWRRADCAPLWWVDGLDLAPGQAYTRNLAGLGLGPEQVVLGVLEGNALLVLSGELDCSPPSSQVDALHSVQTTREFSVHWSSADPDRVLASYDVQVRDGDSGAPWVDWMIGMTATSALYQGQDGQTYTFRSRARDLFGHVEPWPAGTWQDTFTTVLLQSAPVLVTSDKVAQPLHVHPGDVMGFQIHLRNTGNLTASVQITDPLPANLMLAAGPNASRPPEPEYSSETHSVLWQGSLAAGETDLTLGFDAQVLYLSPSGVVTNAIWIDDGVHPVLRRQAGSWLGVYIPLLFKNSH
jgi:uncharacterized repeat protein (TIGR01451 family)